MIDPLSLWKMVGRGIAGMPTQQERADLRQNVREVQGWFQQQGVAANEGAGKVSVSEMPWFSNAAYIPKSDALISDKMVVGRLFGREFKLGERGAALGSSKGVVAHELSHRVVGHLAPKLGYAGQAGAWQESLADTMAAAMTPGWVLGADVRPGGIRSLEHPGTKEGKRPAQPEHMKDYKSGGGEHGNAGITNRAAFLIGSKLGKEAMAKIYLEAIRSPLFNEENVSFKQGALAVALAAKKVSGGDRETLKTVLSAFGEVGILDAPPAAKPADTPPDA